MPKFILVTGGVISGLGKGVAVSCVGNLLKRCGYQVTALKIDPYLNTDAGTMSPHEHGETFVLQDGSEVDLDLGGYERMLDINLTKDHNLTSGKLFYQVIQAERAGKYLGQTVQMIPHVTDAIKDWIANIGSTIVKEDLMPDICLIELGGTVGDLESMIYMEALSQIKADLGQDFCHLHVTLIPQSGTQQKTKPTQHSCRQLASYGLQPDFILGRCEIPLTVEAKEKISRFCGVPVEKVITMHQVDRFQDIPHLLELQNIHTLILRHFHLRNGWELQPFNLLSDDETDPKTVRVALPGKYTVADDTYLSIRRAFEHVEAELQVKVVIELLDVEQLDFKVLKHFQAILIPGGFGIRGIKEKMAVIRYAREHQVPFLGICLGFQLAAHSPDGTRIEALELANHPFFVAVQYHPEFKSRPRQARTPLYRNSETTFLTKVINIHSTVTIKKVIDVSHYTFFFFVLFIKSKHNNKTKKPLHQQIPPHEKGL